MPIQRSQSIFERARAVIPGGVNSPVRACRSVGTDPVFIASGKNARVTDADGNEYLDLIGSWGPLILGHCHPEIVTAITEALALGATFGAPTEIEVRFAEALRAAVPSMEMVRAVSSGTSRGRSRRARAPQVLSPCYGAPMIAPTGSTATRARSAPRIATPCCRSRRAASSSTASTCGHPIRFRTASVRAPRTAPSGWLAGSAWRSAARRSGRP
ncbi:MAG: aminotransferase class III-fold pyridoxal phosphate-dependent enzyme [Myxococcales bacterium]|nr:aminotransferase class III-fold pyridoxal phosphate-dependent enzyme [Myxococcales bacterium]